MKIDMHDYLGEDHLFIYLFAWRGETPPWVAANPCGERRVGIMFVIASLQKPSHTL